MTVNHDFRKLWNEVEVAYFEDDLLQITGRKCEKPRSWRHLYSGNWWLVSWCTSTVNCIHIYHSDSGLRSINNWP